MTGPPAAARWENVWTLSVCSDCGKPHAGRKPSCVVEFDSAGDTFAETEQVEVVRLSEALRQWQLGFDAGARRTIESELASGGSGEARTIYVKCSRCHRDLLEESGLLELAGEDLSNVEATGEQAARNEQIVAAREALAGSGEAPAGLAREDLEALKRRLDGVYMFGDRTHIAHVQSWLRSALRAPSSTEGEG